MYNANRPGPDDLPSAAQLLKSTLLAAIAAVVILVTVVLPAEYGIDPTRIGRMLGLAEMGEIKVQLAREAEADRQMEQQQREGERRPDDRSGLLNRMFRLVIGTAHAQAAPAWRDEVSVTLKPGQGAEIKLTMEKGAVAEFAWAVDGGVVNYDLHADGSGQTISYEKGLAVPRKEGSLKAAFAGNHGWYWRNRGKQDVTVKLSVRGDYKQVKRVE